MSTVHACPQCGTPLAAGVAQGLCPKCLLNVGFASNASGSGVEATSAYSNSASKAFAAPMPAELAPLFPQFEAIELIGQGGMGAVYKAKQPKLDRWVAIKVLPRDAAQSPGFADRFTREARALAQLSHPNIVAVHDFGETDGLYFFVMEYVDGTDLRRLVAARELSPETALAIVPQVCDALQFAHAEGIVHRDVKPENILVDKKGRVKMADFGLAKLLGRDGDSGHLTATHQVMGTPRYMAPEQIERPQLVDHRADIYALGVVLYEMLTGELPLGRFAPPSAKVQVDVRLDEVVFRALEKEPERRYQHASEVKSDVERIARPAANAQAVSAGSSGGVHPSPGETFVVFNPSLPKIAQWICAYALVISPVLFALEFSGLLVFTLDSDDYITIADELISLPLSFLTVVLLFVGGLKLRGLQRSGVGWLKAGFGLEIVWLPIYLVLWLVWIAGHPTVLEAPSQPGNGRDFIGLSLTMLCYAFDIFAFIWLTRFGRDVVEARVTS